MGKGHLCILSRALILKYTLYNRERAIFTVSWIFGRQVHVIQHEKELFAQPEH